jgi:hypothetical protein
LGKGRQSKADCQSYRAPSLTSSPFFSFPSGLLFFGSLL